MPLATVKLGLCDSPPPPPPPSFPSSNEFSLKVQFTLMQPQILANQTVFELDETSGCVCLCTLVADDLNKLAVATVS